MKLESTDLAAMTAVLALWMGIGVAPVAHADARADRDAVIELMQCYARGTDAIGDTSLADRRAAGAAIYKECFVPEAPFRVWFPQQPFDRQAFPNPAAHPDTAPKPVVGPEAWSLFVEGVFGAKHYDFTQHLLGNYHVKLDGNTARLTALLNATHVRSGEGIGAPSRCVEVANGTYSIEAKKVRGRWWITELNLTVFGFNAVAQSGAGC